MKEDQLTHELVTVLCPVANELETALGHTVDWIAVEVVARAKVVARAIIADEPTAGVYARNWVKASFPHEVPAEFWKSDIGQVLFGADGFPARPATRKEAEMVLDVSRQRVGQMISEGHLILNDGNVNRESLYQHWRELGRQRGRRRLVGQRQGW